MARLHPLTSVCLFLIASCMVFIRSDFSYQISLATVAVFLLLFLNKSRNVVRFLLVGAARVVLYVSVLYLFLSQVSGEQIFFRWPWGCYISDKTISVAVGVGARLSNLLLLAGACLGSVTPSSLSRSLNQAGIPYSLCFVVLLTTQVFERLLADWEFVRDGLRSRGLKFRGNILTRSGRIPILYGISAFILLTLRQVSDIYVSATFRGLDQGIHCRTHLETYRWKRLDFLLIAIGVISAGVAYYVLV